MVAAGLVALACAATVARADETDALIERGVACFRDGDFACAERALQAAHVRDPRDADVGLLLGITEYRLGHPADAEPLLRAAAASSDAETASSARIFLGLVASDRGEIDTAQAEFDAAARGGPSDLGDSARGLMASHGAKRWQLVLLVRPEFDSNVPLFPLTPLVIGDKAQADGDLLILGAATYRPWRRIGLSVDETASYRQQFTLFDYSMFANQLSPRYDYVGRNDRVALAYTFELMTLGGRLFTLGHVADAAYRRRLLADLGLGVRYTFRYRDYFPEGYAPFSGPTHTGVVEASWGAPEQRLEIAAGYVLSYELTPTDRSFTALGQGGRLRARLHVGKRLDVGFTGWAVYRAFDDVTRRDTQLYGDLSLAIDLTRHIGLLVGGSVVRNLSTLPDYDYLKATGHLGVAFGYAGP
jgi:tetratricopeptide (TPR) repeat protein